MKIRLDAQHGPSAAEAAGIETAFRRLLEHASDQEGQEAAQARWVQTLDRAKATVRIGLRRQGDG